MPDKPYTQPAANIPGIIVPGKPFVFKFPSPELNDRILVVRKDARVAGFQLPCQGSAYQGPKQEIYCDFLFATAAPADQASYIDLYYINDRRNQERYNFEITYPYNDTNFPVYTRTYVYLRGDPEAAEPQVNTPDPVLPALQLTDHKQIRLDDPILDSLFVAIQRTFEILPGPVITSFGMIETQQRVTIETQAQKDGLPLAEDALTEVSKVERTGTAKEVVTRGQLGELFTAQQYDAMREERALPYLFRAAYPLLTTSQIQAGIAVPPTLDAQTWAASQHQITKFKKLVMASVHTLTNGLVTLLGFRLTPEQQLAGTTDSWSDSPQTIVPDATLVRAEVSSLGIYGSLKHEERVPNVFPQDSFQVSVPDTRPISMRAANPTVTTSVTSAGTAAQPTLATGQYAARSQQVTEYIKRDELTSRSDNDLPVVQTDAALTEQFGGGELSIVRTLDAPGQTVDQGYKVLTSETRSTSPTEQLKETRELADTEWPILVDDTKDSVDGILLHVTKQVVPKHTVYAPAAGEYLDIQDLDKWRSIQIISSIDPDSLPPETQVPASAALSLPARLLEVRAVWQITQSQSSSSHTIAGEPPTGPFQFAAVAQAVAGVTVTGDIIVKKRMGFHGMAPGYMTRTFYLGPPDPSLVPPVTLILPAYGAAILTGRHVSATKKEGTFDFEDAQEGQLVIAAREIGPVLTGGYIITTPTYPVASALVSASAADKVKTFNPVIETSAGDANMVVDLPVSTPEFLAAGTDLVVGVHVEKRRFNVYVVEVIHAYVPAT